jgi:hypothetical protein
MVCGSCSARTPNRKRTRWIPPLHRGSGTCRVLGTSLNRRACGSMTHMAALSCSCDMWACRRINIAPPALGAYALHMRQDRWRLVVSRDNGDQKSRASSTHRTSLAVRNSENCQYFLPSFRASRHDTSLWFLFCLASWGVCLTTRLFARGGCGSTFSSGLSSKRRKLTCVRRYKSKNRGDHHPHFHPILQSLGRLPVLVLSGFLLRRACMCSATPLTLPTCSPQRAGLESVMLASAFQTISNWATR